MRLAPKFLIEVRVAHQPIQESSIHHRFMYRFGG